LSTAAAAAANRTGSAAFRVKEDIEAKIERVRAKVDNFEVKIENVEAQIEAIDYQLIDTKVLKDKWDGMGVDEKAGFKNTKGEPDMWVYHNVQQGVLKEKQRVLM